MLDAQRQVFVLQQHQVHIEQRGQLGRCVLGRHAGNAVLQLEQLLHHLVTCDAHPVDLGLDLGRLDEVMLHVHATDQHGAPDGDTARYGQAMN